VNIASLARLSLLLSALSLVTAGTGIAFAGAPTTDDEAEKYRPLMIEQIDQALAGARALRACLDTGDLESAKAAWIAARGGWERAEVFTSGFTSELDAEIDAWPNAVTGFHAIEAKLFGAHRLDVVPETDALVFHLTDLRIKIRDTPLTGQGLLEGAAKLAFEVGESKASGGESRFSGTSLDDMRYNVEGIAAVFRVVFAAPLAARQPALAETLRSKIERLESVLRVESLADLDPEEVRAGSEELVVALQNAAPVLGLDKPSLADLAQQ
jgi:iron uptake system EfeUOB component EfeO/EfeM